MYAQLYIFNFHYFFPTVTEQNVTVFLYCFGFVILFRFFCVLWACGFGWGFLFVV